jgi:hypothetical protein
MVTDVSERLLLSTNSPGDGGSLKEAVHDRSMQYVIPDWLLDFKKMALLGQLWNLNMDYILDNMNVLPGVIAHTCIPSSSGSRDKRTMVQSQPGKS